MLCQLQLFQQQRTGQVKTSNQKEHFLCQVWAWFIILFLSFSLDLICLLLSWTKKLITKNQSLCLQLSEAKYSRITTAQIRMYTINVAYIMDVAYVDKQALLEPILLYGASKFK